MSEYRVANRYAKSLYEMAASENVTEAVYNDLTVVIEVTEKNRELQSLLKSPVVSGQKKLAILEKSFAGMNDRTKGFFELLISKKREASLLAICKEFVKRYEDQKGVARATVTSAVPLSDNALEQIVKYLKGAIQKEDVQITNVVDEKVIGGMVVRYEDKRLDLSVARELKEIKKTLIYN